jgi:hypothetical protein
MSLTDWIHWVLESRDSTCTCCATPDPSESVEEIEEELIATVGCNLNGVKQRRTKGEEPEHQHDGA